MNRLVIFTAFLILASGCATALNSKRYPSCEETFSKTLYEMGINYEFKKRITGKCRQDDGSVVRIELIFKLMPAGNKVYYEVYGTYGDELTRHAGMLPQPPSRGQSDFEREYEYLLH